MGKLLKPLSYFIFTILLASLSTTGFAQLCPTPIDLDAKLFGTTNQIQLVWKSQIGVSGYSIKANFDNGSKGSFISNGNSIMINTPASFNWVDIHLASKCGTDESNLLKKRFVVITEGEIDQLCDDIENIPSSFMIILVDKTGKTIADAMTPAEFESMFCNGIGTLRLPSIVEEDVAIAPNPFTDAISIKLSLPIASEISINLYGSNGQLIRTLANHEMTEAGVNNLQYNTNDLPAGVYFVRMAIDGEQSIHKVVKLE